MTEKRNHVAVVVDGGPKLISFIVNGAFHDGGEYRQFGWGRFGKDFRSANGSGEITLDSCIESLRIFDRPLRTFEVIAYLEKEVEG
jgi:hypothetical protein